MVEFNNNVSFGARQGRTGQKGEPGLTVSTKIFSQKIETVKLHVFKNKL